MASYTVDVPEGSILYRKMFGIMGMLIDKFDEPIPSKTASDSMTQSLRAVSPRRGADCC